MKIILLLLVVIVGYLMCTKKKGFNMMAYNIPEPTKQPVMYGRDSCPYTVKMKKQMKDDGVLDKFEYVDVTTKEGGARFEASGGEGVPHFEHNGRVAVGFMPSSKLLKMLNM